MNVILFDNGWDDPTVRCPQGHDWQPNTLALSRHGLTPEMAPCPVCWHGAPLTPDAIRSAQHGQTTPEVQA